MDRESGLRFLHTLFPEIPDDSSILIWSQKGKRSHWANTHDQAIEYASKISGNLYVGACLAPRGLRQNVRATSDNATWISAVRADVDIFHGNPEVHKGKNAALPTSAQEATSLVLEMPLSPTVIIHSGHGLQAWWMLVELFCLQDPEDRERAKVTSEGWHRLLLSKAEAHGWTVDATFDLARLMRIPGTMNFKEAANPVQARLLDMAPERRYQLEDIEQYIIDEPAKKAQPSGQDKQLVLPAKPVFVMNHDATPPAGKFQAILENDSRFAATWRRERRDLKDQSNSGYDLSVANQLVLVRWTDQEIVDTLIAFRRNHSVEKLRYDYYLRTLTEARTTTVQDATDERIKELSTICQIEGQMPDGLSDEALKKISDWFGFKVKSIERTMSEEPVYLLSTEKGSIRLGTIEAIDSQAIFRRRVATATKIWIKLKSKKEWEDYKQVILSATANVELGPEATAHGMSSRMIESYLDGNPPADADADDLDDVTIARAGYPMVRTSDGEDTLILDSVHIRDWLRTAWAEKISVHEGTLALKISGFINKQVKIKGKNYRRWLRKRFVVNEC